MNGHKTKKNLLVINNHFCESITTANNNPGERAIWGGVLNDFVEHVRIFGLTYS